MPSARARTCMPSSMKWPSVTASIVNSTRLGSARCSFAMTSSRRSRARPRPNPGINIARSSCSVRASKAARSSGSATPRPYGAPPQIVTAIIGVETRYGTHQGKYRIIDALTTLAFDYPPRAKFFRGELEQYLLLTREEKLDPLDMTGSYAGAFGQAQFIASSYRRYAIDFDGDGHRDLWQNPVDAVGSVANYLKENGWERGGAVAVPATASGDALPSLLQDGLKPKRPWKELKKQGVTTQANVSADTPAALIALEQEAGPVYWVGLQTFYVVTRYNRSPLYAMAVYQLSEEIRSLHEQRVARPQPGE